MAEASKTLADLRKPFPKESVGLLPKPFSKDAKKGNCQECGKYHGLPAVHLDYVGHAAVTDRLLEVDPNWSWEPMAVDEDGLPKTDRAGNLWIKLTVLGVTRIGVGDGSNAKECIGDALRNAAMRFGVALDLWSKEELESVHEGETQANEKPSESKQQPAPAPKPPVKNYGTPHPRMNEPEIEADPLDDKKREIMGELSDLGYIQVQMKAFITSVIGQSKIETVQQAEDVLEAIRIEKENN